MEHFPAEENNPKTGLLLHTVPHSVPKSKRKFSNIQKKQQSLTSLQAQLEIGFAEVLSSSGVSRV